MSEAASAIGSDADKAAIEFAPWRTIIENDDLAFGRLHFDIGPTLLSYADGRRLSLPPDSRERRFVLEATFVSVEKQAVVRVGCNDPIAFRVVDEKGLLDLWHASMTTDRPGRTTFRATGHKWTRESFLVFLDTGEKPLFSHFIATGDLCLELVCNNEPVVEMVGPAVLERHR